MGGLLYLAWKELTRAKFRFGLLMVVVGLLVFLILFQQTLQEGLINAFVGGLRNQSAPAVVLGVDGRRNLQGSVILPPLEAEIRAVPGVGSSGRLGQRTVSTTAGGALRSAGLFAYEHDGLGSPTTVVAGRSAEAPGEAVASDVDASKGFGIGDRVRVEPGGYEITVVGLAGNAQLFAAPTLYIGWATYESAIRSVNAEATSVLPSAIAITPVEGLSPEQLVQRVNDSIPDADALTRTQLADGAPGVAQVRQSFRVIFLLYGLVIPFVTGLFFLIITFQKANALTLLRAVGAPGRRLVDALLVQVVMVIGVGLLLGIAMYAPLSVQRVGSISLQFQTGAVIVWSVLLLTLGLLSSLFSARRVLRIEPMAATTGAGVQR